MPAMEQQATQTLPLLLLRLQLRQLLVVVLPLIVPVKETTILMRVIPALLVHTTLGSCHDTISSRRASRLTLLHMCAREHCQARLICSIFDSYYSMLCVHGVYISKHKV
jgi:uncharacterized membrane protein YjdF